MRQASAVWISISISIVAGICCGHLAARSVVFRDELGIICGRGHLLALVHGQGRYQADVDRIVNESHYRAGAEYNEGTSVERQSALTDLIANTALVAGAARERIPRADVTRAISLLRSQFRDDKTWRQALNQSGLVTLSLSRTLTNDLRARQWISKRISPELTATDAESRGFYESHPENFFVPERHHVGHLFLAAPADTAPETIERKQIAIGILSVRLAHGEDFATLAAQTSEDEATKLRGGDLGYFSASRMPPDFFEATLKLHPGEISKPIRTRLGFHILKLIDVQPARQKMFDEARNDIAIELANQKRATAIQQLIDSLASPLVNPLGLSRPRRSAPAGSVVDLSSETGYLRPL